MPCPVRLCPRGRSLGQALPWSPLSLPSPCSYRSCRWALPGGKPSRAALASGRGCCRPPSPGAPSPPLPSPALPCPLSRNAASSNKLWPAAGLSGSRKQPVNRSNGDACYSPSFQSQALGLCTWLYNLITCICSYICNFTEEHHTTRANRRPHTINTADASNTANITMLNSSPDSSVCYFFTRPHYYCITCVFSLTFQL